MFVSIQNLKSATQNLKMNSGLFHDISFVTFQSNDGLSAARLLLPEFYSNVAPVIGSEFLVGLPYRDFLVALEKKKSKHQEKLIQKIRDDFNNRSHPITDRIFFMDAKGIHNFQT